MSETCRLNVNGGLDAPPRRADLSDRTWVTVSSPRTSPLARMGGLRRKWLPNAPKAGHERGSLFAPFDAINRLTTRNRAVLPVITTAMACQCTHESGSGHRACPAGRAGCGTIRPCLALDGTRLRSRHRRRRRRRRHCHHRRRRRRHPRRHRRPLQPSRHLAHPARCHRMRRSLPAAAALRRLRPLIPVGATPARTAVLQAAMAASHATHRAACSEWHAACDMDP